MIKKILLIGIIVLFLGTCIIPSVAIDNVKKPKTPMNSGNTLYVGGLGSFNYTKIQDALDNASSGDTVFVYDDSSPYYEYNLTIEKSINLIGEDKDTTEINAIGKGDVILVYADKANISGFMIVNGNNTGKSGICLLSDYNIITENNIINCVFGVFLQYSSHNYISKNNIYNNSLGIATWYSNCDYNTFYDNYLFNNQNGIFLTESTHCQIIDNIIKCETTTYLTRGIGLQEFSTNNEIIGNDISNYELGIFMCSSINTLIQGNNISSNRRFGLYLQHGSVNNNITRNNFINNGYEKSYKIRGNAFFIDSEFIPYSNIWNENYWDNWLGVKHKLFRIFPYRVPGRWGIIQGIGILFPTSDFDLHPTKEPYDI